MSEMAEECRGTGFGPLSSDHPGMPLAHEHVLRRPRSRGVACSYSGDHVAYPNIQGANDHHITQYGQLCDATVFKQTICALRVRIEDLARLRSASIGRRMACLMDCLRALVCVTTELR